MTQAILHSYYTFSELNREQLQAKLKTCEKNIEGEYWGLKERFEILVAGRSEHAELEIGPEHAEKLAEISLKRGISVILDLSDFTPEESHTFLLAYFKSLWATSAVVKKPYQIILEEAHEFVPQNVNTPLKQVLTRIALRGRKRGLGIILMSQRSAKVEKDMLTQASLLFLHKVVHPIDLRVYKDLIPLPSAQVETMVRKLGPGEAIVVYNHEANVIQLRLRYTFHGGATPVLNQIAQPKLRKLNTGLLKELRMLTAQAAQSTSSDSEQVKLTKKVEELEQLLALKDTEIQHLQSQVDLLSKLSVTIEGVSAMAQFPDTQTLNVDKAVVRQVIAGGSMVSVSPVGGGNTSTIQLPQISPTREVSDPREEGILSPVERRKLDFIIQRLRKLPKLQFAILRLLVEHEGSTMTVPMMASWLSFKESTIRNHPPHDLIQMKLVTRTRGSRGYRYASSASAYFRTEFAQVDPDFIIQQIF